MKKSYTVFLRYVCVAGLFNVTYSRITRDENLFVKTNFVCDLDDNSGIIERSGKTSFGLCALLCQQDARCFSFQYNYLTQHCCTMTLNRNGVRASINNTNEQEAVYLKGMHSFAVLMKFW